MHNPFGHSMVRVESGKYVESFVYHKVSGDRILRAPVDARELVNSGEYSYAPVSVAEPVAVEVPAVPEAVPVPVADKRPPGRPRKAGAA